MQELNLLAHVFVMSVAPRAAQNIHIPLCLFAMLFRNSVLVVYMSS